jgi:hypothetical protein
VVGLRRSPPSEPFYTLITMRSTSSRLRLVAPAIIELRPAVEAWFAIAASFFEGATVLEIGGDAGRSEGVATLRRGPETCLELLTCWRRRSIRRLKTINEMGGKEVTRPRAADDFKVIRARMEELRREREGAGRTEDDLQRDPPMQRARSVRWPPSEISSGTGRVRQS